MSGNTGSWSYGWPPSTVYGVYMVPYEWSRPSAVTLSGTIGLYPTYGRQPAVYNRTLDGRIMMAVLRCMVKNVDNNNKCAHPSAAFERVTNKMVLFECEND